jgi:hypothetical protein
MVAHSSKEGLYQRAEREVRKKHDDDVHFFGKREGDVHGQEDSSLSFWRHNIKKFARIQRWQWYHTSEFQTKKQFVLLWTLQKEDSTLELWTKNAKHD